MIGELSQKQIAEQLEQSKVTVGDSDRAREMCAHFESKSGGQKLFGLGAKSIAKAVESNESGAANIVVESLIDKYFSDGRFSRLSPEGGIKTLLNKVREEMVSEIDDAISSISESLTEDLY